MFNVIQLRELIIKPVLFDLVCFSEDAVELLLFTCAAESDGGTYIKQIKGPALGIYQMQPETYNDLWENYIKNKSSLLMRLFTNFNVSHVPSEDRMIYDLRFATAMARIFYLRLIETIPDKNDIDAIWEYYKKNYNTDDGSSKKEDSLKKYNLFIKH